MRTEGNIKEKEGQSGDVQHGPEVMITVNSISVRIHRGNRTVAEIKTAANVPLAEDLEQIINGKLVPLPDDGSLTIKGGEQFVSHPKDGAAS